MRLTVNGVVMNAQRRPRLRGVGLAGGYGELPQQASRSRLEDVQLLHWTVRGSFRRDFLDTVRINKTPAAWGVSDQTPGSATMRWLATTVTCWDEPVETSINAAPTGHPRIAPAAWPANEIEVRNGTGGLAHPLERAHDTSAFRLDALDVIPAFDYFFSNKNLPSLRMAGVNFSASFASSQGSITSSRTW